MSDIQKFLSPISPEKPSGDDMGFSAEFDAIKRAREEDDPSLQQGEWQTAIKEADWSSVVSISEKLLLQKTKDLRVVGWLLEGWTKREGFGGLARGLDLLSGICETFWHSVYPRMEDDESGDQELRAGNIAWIISNSCELARQVPLTNTDSGRYGLLYWDAANKLANDIRRSPNDAASLSRGRLTLDDFNAARVSTPPDFYENLFADVNACRDSLDALAPTLDQCFGADNAPSVTPLRQLLETIEDLVRRFAGDAGADIAHSEPVAVTEELPQTTEPTEVTSVSGPITSRQQALAQLKVIAAYFRETEPHSPVAYLADKAAHWGNQPLHVWLKAVVKNNETLLSLEEMLGVNEDGGKSS
jgi:type VI secretion system protein ImpA